jgi:hypothetical protein
MLCKTEHCEGVIAQNSRTNLCKKCKDKKSRQRRIEHGKDERRQDHLKYDYGITIKQWEEMFKEQEGACAICGQPETVIFRRKGNPDKVRRLAVDHDKETKIVCGLLCLNCNLGIGAFKHNLKLVQKAIQYLQDSDL